MDWDKIKEIWTSGVGSLEDAAAMMNVSIAEIMLRAKQDKWGNRATPAILDDQYEDIPYSNVANEYRRTLFRVKKMCDAVLVALNSETNAMSRLQALDNVSKVLSRIMPLNLEVTDFKESLGMSDDKIAEMVKEEQLKALRRGDVKMLMFLGKQYLNQKDMLGIFSQEIPDNITPKEAADMFNGMMKGLKRE